MGLRSKYRCSAPVRFLATTTSASANPLFRRTRRRKSLATYPNKTETPICITAKTGGVVDALGWPQELQGLPVALSTRTPRRGEVSYRLGRLRYTQGVDAGGAGQVIGFAALVGGQLVIASNTYSAPGIADLFK